MVSEGTKGKDAMSKAEISFLISFPCIIFMFLKIHFMISFKKNIYLIRSKAERLVDESLKTDGLRRSFYRLGEHFKRFRCTNCRVECKLHVQNN